MRAHGRVDGSEDAVQKPAAVGPHRDPVCWSLAPACAGNADADMDGLRRVGADDSRSTRVFHLVQRRTRVHNGDRCDDYMVRVRDKGAAYCL